MCANLIKLILTQVDWEHETLLKQSTQVDWEGWNGVLHREPGRVHEVVGHQVTSFSHY